MGKRIQKDQKTVERNRSTERTDNKTTCKKHAGRKQKPQDPEPVTADLIKILLDHCFPNFNGWLGELPDPRLEPRIVYSKEH